MITPGSLNSNSDNCTKKKKQNTMLAMVGDPLSMVKVNAYTGIEGPPDKAATKLPYLLKYHLHP